MKKIMGFTITKLSVMLFNLCCIGLIINACDVGPDGNAYEYDGLFDSTRVIEIEISLNPSDWDTIRQQQRDEANAFGPNYDQPPESPFTYVIADILIDGVLIENVGPRKKGWLSSYETERPSLKIKFDKYIDNIDVQGYDRLTLNNTVEEARRLTAAARRHEVVTVMGNQGHCWEGIRRAKEWFEQGFLGDVTEVHIWSACPEWTQGYQKFPKPQQPPEHLDWNLWLGVA